MSLPEEDVQRARVVAARRGTSVSRLVADALREVVEHDRGYRPARERSLEMMTSGPGLGTGGEITWDRDHLHER